MYNVCHMLCTPNSDVEIVTPKVMDLEMRPLGGDWEMGGVPR